MRIEEHDINQSRGEIALDIMISGQESLEFRNIAITSEGYVYICSSWTLENVSKEEALREFDQGKKLFSQLCGTWQKLKSFFDKTAPAFELIYDYGTGAVCILSLSSKNEPIWHI